MQMLSEKKGSNTPSNLTVYVRVAVVSYLLLMDAIVVTYIFPYLGRIVTAYGLVNDPIEEGKYTGYITASYYLGRALAGPAWGYAADHWGRKPVIFVSGGLVAIFNFFFGTATSFTSLLIFRFLTGFSNTVSGISLTLSTEVCTPETKSLSLAISLTVWCVGENIGPMVGGLGYGFFESQPYLMNTFISSGACIGGIFLAMFLLEETLHAQPLATQGSPQSPRNRQSLRIPIAPTLSIRKMSSVNEIGKQLCYPVEEVKKPQDDKENQATEMYALPKTSETLSVAQLRRASSHIAYKDIEDSNMEQPLIEVRESETKKGWTVVYDLVTLSALCNTFFIILRQVIPQWTQAPYEKHGLGLSEKDVSIILGINAIPGIILTPTLYPYLAKRLGDAKMIYIYSIINVAMFPCFPVVRLFSLSPEAIKIFLALLWFIRQTAAFFGTLSLQRLINDSVETAQRAKLNNISRTFSSLLSVVIPGFFSFTMSWTLANDNMFPFNYFLVFLLCTAIALGSHVQMVNRVQIDAHNKQKGVY